MLLPGGEFRCPTGTGGVVTGFAFGRLGEGAAVGDRLVAGWAVPGVCAGSLAVPVGQGVVEGFLADADLVGRGVGQQAQRVADHVPGQPGFTGAADVGAGELVGGALQLVRGFQRSRGFQPGGIAVRIAARAVPEPGQTRDYIANALAGYEAGHMLSWAVRELASGRVVGSTRYHDIVTAVDRVEIGYTWYAKSWQRSHVNTSCKLLLLGHAFDVLGCKVVGLRTDNFNFASQRAIEGLGARKDGILRHHQARRDGTVRDSVIYSILLSEWPDVRRHLELRLARHETSPKL